MGTALLVVTAVAGAAGAWMTHKAGKVQRKQNAISNRIAATQRTREVRRSIAARRIQTANVQSQGFQLGVAGGTAVQGATFGMASDSASSIAASNQQLTGQQVLSGLSDKISSLQSQASTFGAISSLAGMFTGDVGTEGAQNRAAIASLIG